MGWGERRTVDTPNDMVSWGSECVDCHNATPGSMVCDSCQSDRYTIPLYFSQAAYATAESYVLASQ